MGKLDKSSFAAGNDKKPVNRVDGNLREYVLMNPVSLCGLMVFPLGEHSCIAPVSVHWKRRSSPDPNANTMHATTNDARRSKT